MKKVKAKLAPEVVHEDPVEATYRPKPAVKTATILYKKLPDDIILITGFENFLTPDEVFEKYGKEVAKIYLGYPNRICRTFQGDGSPCLTMFRNEMFLMNVCIGSFHNKEVFSKIIAHVKKCGGLLHDIIQAVENGEVKQIGI